MTASSRGERSSRCRFSMSAISSAVESSNRSTIAGTVSFPASFEARHRRQPQAVLDVALVLAQLRREVPDRVPELVRHLLVDDGFIEGRKILALQVLDECDLERGRIVTPLRAPGDGLFPGELRGAPPA